MILIYRIEMSNEMKGPYTHSYIKPSQWLVSNHGIMTHPVPQDDGISNFLGNRFMGCDYSGFSSIKSLKDWFCNRELINLHRLNFVCKVFQVNENDVKHGYHQVAFKRESYEPIEIIELEYLVRYRNAV